MLCPVIRSARVALTLGLLSFAAGALAQSTKTATEYTDSHIDIYGGYGYLHPFNSEVNNFSYRTVDNENTTDSITGYFSHYLGVQVEGTYFSGAAEHAVYAPRCSGSRCDQNYYAVEAGPIFRWPLGPVIPFVHVLGGAVRINGPVVQPITWGQGVTGGVGFDYVLPFLDKHIAIRPIQADLMYAHANYGPQTTGTNGGVGDLLAVKLSGGLVVRFGESEVKQAVMLGCTAEPAVVHPGDPITVTGSALYLNPHKKAQYTWIANGGKITTSGSTATIDTTGVAPGEYTVSGRISEGPHAREQASCSAPFTVKPFEPPSLSCTATPSTATSGTTIAISTSGTSPQNRPLTYSYSATAGQITSNGPTATLATAGLGASLITVTCNVVDDLGQNASATTSVTLTSQPVPVIPQTQSLCSLSFTRDTRRPVRVDNEAKGCLDDIALTLNQQTDAKLVIVGNASPDEHPEAAAERSLNERQYLTQEKGIDPARIEVRVGDTSGRTTHSFLVPAGATFSDANTQLFDEGTIVRHGQAYGKAGSHAAGHTPVHHRRRPVVQTPATTPPAQ